MRRPSTRAEGAWVPRGAARQEPRVAFGAVDDFAGADARLELRARGGDGAVELRAHVLVRGVGRGEEA